MSSYFGHKNNGTTAKFLFNLYCSNHSVLLFFVKKSTWEGKKSHKTALRSNTKWFFLYYFREGFNANDLEVKRSSRDSGSVPERIKRISVVHYQQETV